MRRIAIALAVVLAGCGGNQQHQMPPPDVNVATVVQKSVTQWDDYSGHIQAIDAAEIRPRVAGHLEAIHYEEGGLVGKGQLLFTIDSREYRAAAAAAAADANRAEARVALASQELKRAERLIGERAISQGELDQRRMEAQQAEADVQAARAHQAQANLDVGFTRITAPFAGRAGEAMVKPGNVVAPNQSVLTTLVSVDPVYVTFVGDERAFLHYQDIVRAGNAESPRNGRTPVLIGLANEDGFPHKGEVDKHLQKGGCEACHKVDSWKATTFDHATTRFMLTGGHAKPACTDCHDLVDEGTPRQRVRFAGLPLACESCHKDPHLGQFQTASGSVSCDRISPAGE